MDSFKLMLKEVMQNPTLAGLQMICAHVEAMENYMPLKVKENAQRAISVFLSEGSFAAEEDMLRLYKIMAKHSKKLGAVKVFEKVDEQGRFEKSLKFHIMWAEVCAQCNDLDSFKNVLTLAKNRLGYSTLDLEAEFRDLADKYFPNCDFFDEEETVAVFNIKARDSKARKNRRRSSLATFEAYAKETNISSAKARKNAVSGSESRVMLRFELIDRPTDGYLAPSVEELRAAMFADQQMSGDDDYLVVPMDITVTQPQEAPVASLQLQSQHVKRIRVLETVAEVELDHPNEDKRPRVHSPAVPVRESVFAHKPRMSPPQLANVDEPCISPALISGSSFAEKVYNNMKAVLSDTVDINKGNLPGVPDESTFTLAPPPSEAFEVFIDGDETLESSKPSDAEKASSEKAKNPQTTTQREPLRAVCLDSASGDVQMETSPKHKDSASDVFRICGDEIGFKKPIMLDDEETMAGAKFCVLGVDKKQDRGIVTSTPAHPMAQPPTHEDFFAPLNHQLEEQMKEENDEEVYAQSGFMRRRSTVAPKMLNVLSKPTPKVRTMQAAERSMEIALDKMKLADARERDAITGANGTDATGVGLSKQAVTSAVNPWDRNLRMEILRRNPIPYYLHNLDTKCPRVSASKVVNIGGENYNIVALIGQGGFAKVYKAINEEGKSLALKYEVPSCPWEVYICEQVKQRLGRENHFTLNSTMQVTEAYVYTDASFLFNEYHPYGTLLDLSNKMKDPSWYIILLIAIQIAKILRDVHASNIIHGDVKPDNFMILNKLGDKCDDTQRILSSPILKLIDWGRAIDMRSLDGQTFTGRAGTDRFDCSEMLDGRPWTYQTDYFGYIGTLHVVIFSKYAEVINSNGVFHLKDTMKRRIVVRPLLEEIFHEFLNIPDCNHQPNWDSTVKKLETEFVTRFAAAEWRSVVARFNQCIA